jgi:hypothetical protein
LQGFLVEARVSGFPELGGNVGFLGDLQLGGAANQGEGPGGAFQLVDLGDQ